MNRSWSDAPRETLWFGLSAGQAGARTRRLDGGGESGCQRWIRVRAHSGWSCNRSHGRRGQERSHASGMAGFGTVASLP